MYVYGSCVCFFQDKYFYINCLVVLVNMFVQFIGFYFYVVQRMVRQGYVFSFDWLVRFMMLLFIGKLDFIDVIFDWLVRLMMLLFIGK